MISRGGGCSSRRSARTRAGGTRLTRLVVSRPAEVAPHPDLLSASRAREDSQGSGQGRLDSAGEHQRNAATMIDLETLQEAAALVHRTVPPTPQYCWPLLSRRVGAELWVKHENHTPIGAFKIRGGLVYLDAVRRVAAEPSRGGDRDHRQSRAEHRARRRAARARGDDRRALRQQHRARTGRWQAFGARLVEAGHDFQAAYEHATELAEQQELHFVQSYDPLLVRGVASYALELFDAVPDLDTVYVPIGLGSGISGVIAAREALGIPPRSSGWSLPTRRPMRCPSLPARPSAPIPPTPWPRVSPCGCPTPPRST